MIVYSACVMFYYRGRILHGKLLLWERITSMEKLSWKKGRTYLRYVLWWYTLKSDFLILRLNSCHYILYFFSFIGYCFFLIMSSRKLLVSLVGEQVKWSEILSGMQIWVQLCVCVYSCVYVCMHLCVYVCVCVCVCYNKNLYGVSSACDGVMKLMALGISFVF